MAIEHLKIKIKHLAAEAKIIRSHERKHQESAEKCLEIAYRPVRHPGTADERRAQQDRYIGYRSDRLREHACLRNHRITTVRQAARNALIAYAYLRGRAYRQIESSSRHGRPSPEWTSILKMIRGFGGVEHRRLDIQALLAWRDADKQRQAA